MLIQDPKRAQKDPPEGDPGDKRRPEVLHRGPQVFAWSPRDPKGNQRDTTTTEDEDEDEDTEDEEDENYYEYEDEDNENDGEDNDEDKNEDDDDDDEGSRRSLLIQCAAVGRSTVNLLKGHPKTSRSGIEDPKEYHRAPNGNPKGC